MKIDYSLMTDFGDKFLFLTTFDRHSINIITLYTLHVQLQIHFHPLERDRKSVKKSEKIQKINVVVIIIP